ncbi:O-acyltransferase like protein-like [Apostichopus japonicus]|uniref:O-acyltransferase like protein-like n=1 Tax=Stichopus japonicus TaxID=307972 RepID=UPI003AB7DF90
MVHPRLSIASALVILLGIFAPICQSQNDLFLPSEAYFEFLEIAFDNVTELDLMYTMLGEPTVSGLSGVFAELSSNVSDECLKDGWTLVSDVLTFKEYALQVRASNANPPTPITMAFTGNVQYLANFELCVAVKENPLREIPMTAKVCDMNVPPYPFEIGLCVPESCSDVDLNLFVNAVLAKYNMNREVYFTCVIDRPWTWDSIFVMIILCLFGVAAIVGTSYDLVFRRRKNTETAVIVNVSTTQEETNIDEAQREDEAGRLPLKEGAPQTGSEVPTPGSVPSANEHDRIAENIERGEVTTSQAVSSGNVILHKVLMSLSFVTNGSQVLNAKKPAANLGALNGLRCLSMWWIIWYHCLRLLRGTRLDNANYVFREIGSKPWFAFNWQATYGVDTFLVLSGLLVTYLTLKQLDKSDGKMNWVMFYVHRYIRLTPVYMVCLGIWTSIVIQIGEGSRKYETFAGGRAICQQYWWANLLYINNLVPYPGNVSQCMGWTWYLANDMQFFIFTPIFIILFYKKHWRRYGVIALVSVTVASIIITSSVSVYWGFTARYYDVKYNNRSEAFPRDADRIYAKPWCRVQAYTVGIFVGFIIFKYRATKIKIPLVWNLICWVFALGVMLTIVLAMEGSNTKPLPQWFAAIWLGTRRFLFASGVGWVAFACVTGNGGPIDTFLSWNLWLPLARLNYCAYLLHPVVIFHFLLTKKTLFHYTPYEHFFFFWGALVTTYMLSLFISLLVEVPTIGIEKALLGRFSKK